MTIEEWQAHCELLRKYQKALDLLYAILHHDAAEEGDTVLEIERIMREAIAAGEPTWQDSRDWLEACDLLRQYHYELK